MDVKQYGKKVQEGLGHEGFEQSVRHRGIKPRHPSDKVGSVSEEFHKF